MHKKEGVKGLVDYFLDGFPQAAKGGKTIGRLLYEKMAYSNPDLKGKRVLRDWLHSFFTIITPYADIKTQTDDLNAILLRHDLIDKGSSSDSSACKPIKNVERITRFDKSGEGTAEVKINPERQKKFVERLNHVRFQASDDPTAADDDAVEVPVMDFAESVTGGEFNTEEFLAAISDNNKVNGCHKKFQFGSCTDAACKLDHTTEGMRRLYLKRVWDLAKASHRPDPAAVLRNIKHALDEIEAQHHSRATGTNE